MDYRRPASSMSNSRPSNGRVEVVDLTSDTEPIASESLHHISVPPPNPASRPPRYNREIIDLSDDTPQAPGQSNLPNPVELRSSPDIQITGARTLSVPRANVLPPINRILEPRGTGADANAAGDDVQFLESRRIPRQPPNVYLNALHNIMNITGGYSSRAGRHLEHILNQNGYEVDGQQGGLDIRLDMGAVGFDLGLGRDSPPAPTYDPPEAVAEGFTRSPREGNVLICPNCEDELSVGDSDVKRQVWVAKQCGHVRDWTLPTYSSM